MLVTMLVFGVGELMVRSQMISVGRRLAGIDHSRPNVNPDGFWEEESPLHASSKLCGLS